MKYEIPEPDEREKIPYKARVAESIANAPGTWNYTKVEILDSEDKVIGSYERNYPSHAENTFAPFTLDGENWYALYSKNYTAVRIMELPSCKDIGGQENDGFGFCPTELFVPIISVSTYKGTFRIDRLNEDWPKFDSHINKFHTKAFVLGCIWGDDTSWKLRTIDLNKAIKGEVVSEEQFGYLEIFHSCSAKDIEVYEDSMPKSQDDLILENDVYIAKNPYIGYEIPSLVRTDDRFQYKEKPICYACGKPHKEEKTEDKGKP